MTIEVTAKKVQDAINQGLQQLGATLDEVDVEVIEQGGLFKKAKIRMTIEREQAPAPEKSNDAVAETKPAREKPDDKPAAPEKPVEENPSSKIPAQDRAKGQAEHRGAPNKKQKRVEAEKGKPAARQKPVLSESAALPAENDCGKPKQKTRKLSDEDKLAAARALEFIRDVIARMGFDGARAEADESGELINITANDGDDSLIIGRHGETLSALSYLAETCVRAEKAHVNIVVDCNGYRDRRAASLTAMAKRRADECVDKRRKIKLEPMERIDRRTVHNALTDDNRVTTSSEGKEPHRYVVITPNRS